MILDRKIESDDVFFNLLDFLSRRGRERDAARLNELARSIADQTAGTG
jgi:ParB family chromosome partitioning protein